MRVLVVINEFGGHSKGHRITDEDEIEKILDGEHAHHVVASDHDEETFSEE